MSLNYIIYYLNFKLRFGLTMFIKTGDIIFDQEQPFITYQFEKLNKLIRDIKNQNYISNNKIILDDINKLFSFIKDTNNDLHALINNIQKIIELFDITSYISLYLFKLYIDNDTIDDKNFGHLKEKNPKDFHNVILELYKFTLIFNEINNSSSSLKKMLVFSLFNIFCVSPFPNIPIFDIYNKKVNCCVLNKSSILLSNFLEGTYLDIFSKNNNFMYEDAMKMITIFDTNGNNLLIANDILYQIFMLLFSKYINILFKINLSNIIIPKDPFHLKYTYDGKETFFHEIIYYLNNLNYKIIKNECDFPCVSVKRFWKNIYKNCSDVFNGLKTYYPFNYLNNNYRFSIYNYLIGFFFNSVSSPQVLLLFVQEYNDRKTKDDNICYKEMYLLLNFIKIYFSKINFKKYKDNFIYKNLNFDNKCIEIDYNNLIDIFDTIKYRKSLLISILLLRRLLPYILNIISEITKIDTKIYFFGNEAIFDNGVKIFNIELDNNQSVNLVYGYLICLSKLLENFSLDWKKYSTYFKNINFINKNFVNIQNYIFYNYGLKNINIKNPNVKKSIDKLNYAYKKKYYKIKVDYNWNFHFYELLFHSFYLTFADFSIVYYRNYGKKRFSDGDPFYIAVKNYLDYYEQNDYYLNFINKNGSKINILREIYKKIDSDEFNYKLFNKKYKLREDLIGQSKYDYMTKEGIQKIDLNCTSFKSYLVNEKQENNLIFNDRLRNNNIFVNGYNKLNPSIQRFLFNEYNDDNISKENYCNDILKLMS